MSVSQRLKSFFQQKKHGIIREARFALIVSLWVGFYVGLMRNQWTQLEERQLQRHFAQSSEDAIDRFESRFQFWDLQAKKIASFAALQPVNVVNMQKDSWAAIYDSHPEWLGSHLVARRDGYEPLVSLALISKQAKRWLPRDTDAPVRWADEAQSSAIQMTSAKTNRNLFIQPLRSLDKENQWVQILFNVKTSKPEWSFWVVHTFSEKILPELFEKSDLHSAVLYFPKERKFLSKENFSSLKIENSELMSVLEKNKTAATGFAKQEFAIAKKTNWLSWKHSKSLDAAFIKILPDKKIPSTGQREAPSLFADWLLSLLWMIISTIALWWSYSKKLWMLSLEEDTRAPSHTESHVILAGLLNSKFRHRGPPSERHPLIDAEWEFCRQMLKCSGPIGKIPLTAKAEASVEVSPSKIYKGSWWIIENFDEDRIFIAVGDATGSGLPAAASAYPIRHLIQTLLKGENEDRDTEIFLSQLYTLCSAASAGVLLDKAHVSLFAAIVDLPHQKLCFLNAGYPAPILKLSSRKSLSLMSYSDPIGMGDNGSPMPRWISLSQKTSLTICNVGARNTDLDELDESELIKIIIHPFGVNDQAQTVPVHDAA